MVNYLAHTIIQPGQLTRQEGDLAETEESGSALVASTFAVSRYEGRDVNGCCWQRSLRDLLKLHLRSDGGTKTHRCRLATAEDGQATMRRRDQEGPLDHHPSPPIAVVMRTLLLRMPHGNAVRSILRESRPGLTTKDVVERSQYGQARFAKRYMPSLGTHGHRRPAASFGAAHVCSKFAMHLFPPLPAWPSIFALSGLALP